MILIDGSMLAMRCITKMDFLKTTTGKPTGLEFGFLRSVESLQSRLHDEDVLIVWDGGNQYRKNICSDYKSNRPPVNNGIWERINQFKCVLKCMYPTIQVRAYEADDILYSIAVQTKDKSIKIVSNDKDLLTACQFSNVQVIRSHESQLFTWDNDKVIEKYGVPARLLCYYLAFVGDSIDNIKGVPYINKKLCAMIIDWCDRLNILDKVYEEMSTADFSSRVLTALKTFDFGQNLKLTSPITLSSPYTDYIEYTPNAEVVSAFLKEYEIRSLKVCKRFGLSILEDAEL